VATRLSHRGWGALAALAVLTAAGVVAWSVLSSPTRMLGAERCVATANGTSHDLAPDQAANAALISAVAVRRDLPARAATIGIATAIQESKLRNLDYGDRDSLGLFQQRPSQGWGTVEQVQDPIYATNAFYDALVAVDGYQQMEITVASDRVQRSAFPDAVADHEPAGRAYASALTGYSPAALTCRLRPADGPGDAGAVVDRLVRHFGEVEAREDGATVQVPAADDDAGRRRAWAVAHWAVAHADDLGIDRVGVDGRQWSRAAPADGWTEAEPAGAGVLIEVAGS
jgi:hypothetical protein